MNKTVPQLMNEIYDIVEGEDLKPMIDIIRKKYPKSLGQLSKLTRDQMVEVLPEIKDRYSHATREALRDFGRNK